MSRDWFVPMRHGAGWGPANAAGWLAVAGFVLLQAALAWGLLTAFPVVWLVVMAASTAGFLGLVRLTSSAEDAA